MDDLEHRLEQLAQLVLELPEDLMHILERLIRSLHLVHANQEVNRMDASNLAIGISTVHRYVFIRHVVQELISWLGDEQCLLLRFCARRRKGWTSSRSGRSARSSRPSSSTTPASSHRPYAPAPVLLYYFKHT
jgi:hypothetical protein